MMNKTKFLITTVAAAGILAFASVAMACTLLVDNGFGTQGDTSAEPGETVEGDSEIDHATEDGSRCDDGMGTNDRDCDYSLGVVNPSQYDSPSSGGTEPSATCHYETPESWAADNTTGTGGSQFATLDTADHTDLGSVTEVEADGALGSNGGSEDDAGRTLETGSTAMCFYSSSSVSGADHLNGAKNGAATATDPVAFTVLEP